MLLKRRQRFGMSTTIILIEGEGKEEKPEKALDANICKCCIIGAESFATLCTQRNYKVKCRSDSVYTPRIYTNYKFNKVYMRVQK